MYRSHLEFDSNSCSAYNSSLFEFFHQCVCHMFSQTNHSPVVWPWCACYSIPRTFLLLHMCWEFKTQHGYTEQNYNHVCRLRAVNMYAQPETMRSIWLYWIRIISWPKQSTRFCSTCLQAA